MKCRILMLTLLFTLTMNISYADNNIKINSLKDLIIERIEYRTQFSNLGTKSGKVFNIYADKPWQRTSIRLNKGQSVIISYLSGKWNVNPHNDKHDANGFPNSPVDSNSYILRFVNEGALCGKIGEKGKPFFIGNTREIIAEKEGELFLVSNDDIKQKAENGYADNSGFLKVVIYELPVKQESATVFLNPQKNFPSFSSHPHKPASHNSIKVISPEEAYLFLLKNINHLKDKSKPNNIISQKTDIFLGKESYYMTFSKKNKDNFQETTTYIICENGSIYKQEQIENEKTDYKMVSSFQTPTLFIAKGVMLSDPPEDQLTYKQACYRLAIKLFITSNTKKTNANLAFFYQGITKYQNKEYYLLSLSKNYRGKNFAVLCDYLVNGDGTILKGIDFNNHTIWEPVS